MAFLLYGFGYASFGVPNGEMPCRIEDIYTAEANLGGHRRVFRSATVVSCPPPPFLILPANVARCNAVKAPVRWQTPPLMVLLACDRRLQGMATEASEKCWRDLNRSRRWQRILGGDKT